jgi:signal transduction histidine kinase
LADTSPIIWILFLATSLAITIIIVAFVVAMVLAQRGQSRTRLRQALLVARAHEDEQAWIASELHDDALQRIALVRAEVEALSGSKLPGTTSLLEDRLRGIEAELVDLGVAVRRIAARLHPTLVDQVGLLPALAAMVLEVTRGSEVSVQINTEGTPERLSQDTARAAYRIVEESLRNAVRHSAGHSATVTLSFSDRDLTLRVQDDGRGFDPAHTPEDRLGLAGLRARALIVGGTAEVRSRPGHGTIVDVLLPLATSRPPARA